MEQFIPKRIRFVILAFFIPCSLSAYGNSRDTILSSVYSTPFFYNVLMNKEGEIYTGTAEGVFKLEGNQLIPIDEEKEGYITLNKEGNPVINPDGIRNYKERSYAYLLPYPDLEIDEYHAGTEENFYICSGGRIYIFDIVPYTYSYPNHSIRTISENFVGTYSGIYLKNKRMNNYLPNFTDGYIREYDGKAFICYDWLMILEPSALATSIIDTSTKNAYEITYKKSLQFRDVFRPDQRSGYYVATASELLKMDQTAKNLDSIYSSKDKINKEIGIIGESRGSMYFTDGPYVLICGLSTNQIDTILELTEPILDGSIDNRHLFALTKNGLYVVNTDNSIQKLASLAKAHTMKMVGSSEIVIATNSGLFHFNTVNQVLSTLITGIEFNRRALYIHKNLIYAGSINGLYTININDFNQLISRNHTPIKKNSIPPYIQIPLLLAILVIALLSYLLFRSEKKLNAVKEQIEELNIDHLDRKQIEEFIQQNLPIASLKSITDHFKSNNSHIYKLIEPDKPGLIIQKLRADKVVEMKNAGCDISEISRVTGLSESYIKKIKAKPSSTA